jgi:hypothetical protein
MNNKEIEKLNKKKSKGVNKRSKKDDYKNNEIRYYDFDHFDKLQNHCIRNGIYDQQKK